MRGLVFDFDGVILDTETPELTVWTRIFHDHGVEMPPDYWTTVIGRGAEQEIERPWALLARLSGTYQETEQTRADRKRRILELIKLEKPRPGMVELMDELADASLPFGIASSSKHAWVDGHLKRIGLFERFPVIVCADDVQRAKPFPDLYLLACERLGVEPRDAAAIEDSPNGIAAAKAAGLFTVAAPNPVTAALDLSEADARIDDTINIGLSWVKTTFLVELN